MYSNNKRLHFKEDAFLYINRLKTRVYISTEQLSITVKITGDMMRWS